MNNKIVYFLNKHSTKIVTALTIGGIISTTVLAVKNTIKAEKILEKIEKEKGKTLTNLEKVKYGWKSFIPTGVSGLTTIGCVIGLNYLNDKKQASLIAAYGILQNSYMQYTENVKKLTKGDELHNLAMQEILTAKYDPELDYPGDGEEELFFDFQSCRFFRATMHRFARAECEAQEILTSRGYLLLNEWYDLLGIPRVDYGYTIGWEDIESCDPYDVHSLEFNAEPMTLANGSVKCYCITSNVPATFDYIYNL